MEQFFTSLTRRQTMLLLTAVTFGGSDSVGLFDHLPDEEGELLRDRAQALLKIPREKRIPLLAQEIKRLVTARRGQVWSADPERLAQVLAKERQAVVEVVLRALPLGTAEAVRAHLPPRRELKLAREVRPQVLQIIRWKLEEAVARTAPKRPGFKFSDVLLLKSREVLTVCDRLGARALALAIAGLPQPDREAFLKKLNPDQRQFAAKLASHAAPRALRDDDARQLISRYQGGKEAADAIRSAGAQRLARAALAQSPEFAARLTERHPGPLGQLLLDWIREERPRITGKIDGGRTDVVHELERLEQNGIIDKPVRLTPPPKQERPAPRPAPPARPASGAPVEPPGGKLALPERPPIHRIPVRPASSSPSRILRAVQLDDAAARPQRASGSGRVVNPAGRPARPQRGADHTSVQRGPRPGGSRRGPRGNTD